MIGDWSYGDSILESKKKIMTYGSARVGACDLDLSSGSFPDWDNYHSDRGCMVTSRGDLLCLDSQVDANQTPVFVSLKSNGSYSRELSAVTPGRFIGVERPAGGSIVCGIRDDLEPVCFNTGFLKPLTSLTKKFGLQPVVKDLFRIPNPRTVTAGAANAQKSCVIQNGEATCWRTPSVEADGTIHMPYKILAKPLRTLAGFIKNFGTDDTVYGRACFLHVDGRLLCEPMSETGSRSGQVVEQDPGVQWKSFEFEVSQPSTSCGLTIAGGVRCTNEHSGTNKNPTFTTVRSGAVLESNGYFLFNDGSYTDKFGVYSENPRTAGNVIFSSYIPGHDHLILATDGKRYAVSYQGPKEVPQASFDKIKDLLATSSGRYFDRATNNCLYFSFTSLNERNCTLYAPQNVDPNAAYAFVSLGNGGSAMWIQENGKVSSNYGGSTELHFLPPTAMNPVP